jgi:hypothetical protein
MNRVLIVANQTLGGKELQEEIRGRAKSGPCEFWVLVPATLRSHLADAPPARVVGNLDDLSVGLTEDDDGRRLAETRLEIELERLKDAGITAAGEIGDPDPVQAIQDTLAVRQFDEIVLATLPEGISRWLRQDLVHKLRRKVDLPITHVVATG